MMTPVSQLLQERKIQICDIKYCIIILYSSLRSTFEEDSLLTLEYLVDREVDPF